MSRSFHVQYPDEALDFKLMVAQNITRLRKEKNISQFSLAARAGLHQTSLSRIEAGESSPTLEVVYMISAALHITPLQLLSKPKSQ